MGVTVAVVMSVLLIVHNFNNRGGSNTNAPFFQNKVHIDD